MLLTPAKKEVRVWVWLSVAASCSSTAAEFGPKVLSQKEAVSISQCPHRWKARGEKVFSFEIAFMYRWGKLTFLATHAGRMSLRGLSVDFAVLGLSKRVAKYSNRQDY